MSEYQYYELQAVDRPLSPDELAEFRARSTRAEITPTRFTNTYHWGDFKGDPRALMEEYFDAFVYVANRGTHRFMLRLPRGLLDLPTAAPYLASGDLRALYLGWLAAAQLGLVEDDAPEPPVPRPRKALHAPAVARRVPTHRPGPARRRGGARRERRPECASDGRARVLSERSL